MLRLYDRIAESYPNQPWVHMVDEKALGWWAHYACLSSNEWADYQRFLRFRKAALYHRAHTWKTLRELLLETLNFQDAITTE